VDLYILHVWDRVTPVEEVMRTLDDLVRAGKIRHMGFSNVPAWYAARAQTLAEAHRQEPLALLQLEYSLVSRSLEREHLPLAQETGISLVPWSPLASGFLTGKYRRVEGQILGSGRVVDYQDSGNPVMEKFARSMGRAVRDQRPALSGAIRTRANGHRGGGGGDGRLGAGVLRRPETLRDPQGLMQAWHAARLNPVRCAPIVRALRESTHRPATETVIASEAPRA